MGQFEGVPNGPREGAHRRVLQYVSHALVGGPEVCLRLEHRRSDQTAGVNANGRSLGLLGDIRILDTARARQIIG